MNYKNAVEYIHSFTKFGSQLGLDRMRLLLNLMGNPQDKLKFVHIAGTNGKGSTAQMSTNILRKAGYTVGTYISPFVVDFRERFQVNGKMIEKSELLELVKKIDVHVQYLKTIGHNVTEFEMITAIAFQFFYDKKCDIVCLEVGLGGKFDATNVIKTPLCAIITSISLDHVEILGDTIEKIAGEKAGIIKENTTVVTYPLQASDALAVFMQKCAQTNSRLILPNSNAVEILECSVLGSKFIYDKEKYKLRLAGIHQIYNAMAVIEAMKVLKTKGYNIPEDDIKYGLKTTTFAARFEIMSKNPFIIVDGAHNKEGVASLSLTLDQLEKEPKIAIIGMMKDKDCKSAVEVIGKRCKAMITIPVNNPRAIKPEDLAITAKEYCNEVYVEYDYQKAIKKAIELKGENGVVIACGSLYMASDMRKEIKEYLKNK